MVDVANVTLHGYGDSLGGVLSSPEAWLQTFRTALSVPLDAKVSAPPPPAAPPSPLRAPCLALISPNSHSTAPACARPQTARARWSDADTAWFFWAPWAVHFTFQWAAFFLYMSWDYRNHAANQLTRAKLPTRHPLEPFWKEQLRMVPLVLFNQLVVWPCTWYVYQWRLWEASSTAAEWPLWALLPAGLALTLVSDAMWYWAHRWMHTRWAWRALHRMHHVAPQSSISATYVHPVEYFLWCVSISTPFVLTGFPIQAWLVPLGWGMLTGAGAHSGYAGKVANADKHNGHHLYHRVNFSLVGVADVLWGTNWEPAAERPRPWSMALDIASTWPSVFGRFQAPTKAELPVDEHLLLKKAAAGEGAAEVSTEATEGTPAGNGTAVRRRRAASHSGARGDAQRATAPHDD